MSDTNPRGLSADEVAERVKLGQTNAVPHHSSRSVGQILRANVLTPFNFLLFGLALAVMIVARSPFNVLFLFAAIINSGVGIFQELRARRTLDRLAILTRPQVIVIRDGKKEEIALEKVVQDDLICLNLGDQIVADGEIVDSESIEIDESLLTGESDPIAKKVGDKVLSGSLVVAGGGVMRAKKVGAESYSAQLTAAAKKFRHIDSELVRGTNRILKWLALSLIVVGPVLLVSQFWAEGCRLGDIFPGLTRIEDAVECNPENAALQAAAGIVGMIPEGLVLLTSAAFMLGAIQLARRKILIQQLPAVETLARVDMLLLDKTGTLTEGNIRYEAAILNDTTQKKTIEKVLATIASRASSPTNDAIRTALADIDAVPFRREIAFSSARKWSAIDIGGKAYIFGAPEIVLAGKSLAESLARAEAIANEGKRVLALVRADTWLEKSTIPTGLTPIAAVVLSEKIRDDAAKTLNYFRSQQVTIKVISGDSPLTVAAVARAVGLKQVQAFDARNLPKVTIDEFESTQSRLKQAIDKSAEAITRKDAATPELSRAAEKFLSIITEHNVFGRVQPEQKRVIAAALKYAGHTVAMTGDGVNDALALKQADLGIAMNSGSAATKAVAEVVLLNNKFAELPRMVAEGRRVIANIERVANLFIIKNVYSGALALGVATLALSYPYLPAQMSVISVLFVGLPAFFLALAPNSRPFHAGFLRRVLSFALPTGLIAALAMLSTEYWLLVQRGLAMEEVGTAVSIVVMLIGSTVLLLLARPWRRWKIGLIAACMAAFLCVLLIPPLAVRFSYHLNLTTLPVALIVATAAICLIIPLRLWLERRWRT